MSHTPGPWKNDCFMVTQDRVGGLEICHTGIIGRNKPPEMAEADARLIAKAPAMLEALQDLMLLTNPLLTHDEQRLHEARKNAQDIIRKVTGDE